MQEITNLRNTREKHFSCDDGTIKAYMYDEDIHYLKNGEYREIDNTIMDKGTHFENRENSFKVTFPKAEERALYRIDNDNYFFKCALLDSKSENATFVANNNCLYITNLLDKLDAKYDIIGSKLKESLILKEYTDKDITFIIETDIDLELQHNKVLGKKDNRILYRLETPFMVSNDKEYSRGVTYELTKKDSYFELTLKLDHEWLKTAEYPVIIDPTVVNGNHHVGNSFIYPGDTGVYKYNYDYLKVGVDSNGTIYRTVVKPSIANITTFDQIIDAELVFYAHAGYDFGTENKRIVAHEITQSWDENNVDWNSIATSYTAPIVGTVLLNAPDKVTENGQIKATIKPSYMNITDLFKKWQKGAPNNGIMLKMPEEQYNPNCPPYFMYSDANDLKPQIGFNPHPSLILIYRTNNGIVNNMSYNDYSFKIGTSKVNINNGNVVNVVDINSTIGSKLPASLSLVYNSYSGASAAKYPVPGWKFNFDERIRPITLESREVIYYLEASGKFNYPYKAEDGTYKDEDGRNLTFRQDGDQFIMTDKYGNTKYFAYRIGLDYALTKIRDVDGNELKIEHNANHQISKVIDSSNLEINVAYENDIITITSPQDTTTVTIENDKIMKIETRIGTAYFQYNDKNIINKISDDTGFSLEYGYMTLPWQENYYDTLLHKVTKVTEKGIDGTLGQTETYIYDINSTTVTNNKDIETKYIFNEQGYTISTLIRKKGDLLADTFGTNQKYIESSGTNKNNKIESNTIINKYTQNKLKNPSFEKEEIDENFGFFGERVTVNPRTGKASYKVDPQEMGYGALFGIIPDGKGFTFSGYIKNPKKVSILFRRTDPYKTDPVGSMVIPPSEEYQRFSYTQEYWPDGNILGMNIESEEEFYIDDVQLEFCNTLNGFNIFDRGGYDDISLDDWNEKSDAAIVSVSTNEKAIKFQGNPNSIKRLSRTLVTSGKKDDIYNLSFWYKNEGIMPSKQIKDAPRSQVTFSYLNETKTDKITDTIDLEYKGEEWVFFSKSFTMKNDYENPEISFELPYQVNNLYITNIMLVKDIGEYSYDYDDEGNIISTSSLENSQNTLKYDKDNRLIGMFNPKGNHFSYEYDNQNKSRVLKGISPTGISNEIEYDSFGNPVRTIINNTNPHNELKDNTFYYIRAKGTKAYLDYKFDIFTLFFKECNCNHKAFKLNKKSDEYYSLELTDRYLGYSGQKPTLFLSESDYTLFKIAKNDNGSYSLTPKKYENLRLTYDNGIVSVLEKSDDDYRQQFYFEDTDTNKFIESTATYSEDGRFLTSTTDSLGIKMTYDIDEVKGLTNSITDSNGTVTTYTYNEKNQTTSVTNNGKTVEYEYNSQDELSKIKTGNKEYSFDYDEFMNTKNIKVNDNVLISNEYEPNNGNLISNTFGNNQSISYTYDDLDRIKSIEKNNSEYLYFYNNLNQICKIKNGITQQLYFYDLANRLSKYVEENTVRRFEMQYEYDKNNNIVKKKTSLNQDEIIEVGYKEFPILSYEYNEDDAILKISVDNKDINYNYDYLGRLTNKNISGNLNIEYTYYTRGEKTSVLVKTIQIEDDIYEYKYDNLYNITDIYLNNKLINHYTYDNFNELLQDDNHIENITYKYSYDLEGNILSKEEYTLGTEELIKKDTFEYNNPNWEDQITKFNDEEITYDEIGNPIKIGDSIELSWTSGQQLKSYKDTEKNIDSNYEYNIDGIRTYKNGTSYYVEGTDIILELGFNGMIYYIRDENGALIGLKHNDDTYYYIKNLQEDIIGIKDANFNTVATYSYDAWGSITSIKDENGNEITDINHIAHINPFRYRSYYYDKETGFYYLNTRYYSPKLGRFINADSTVFTNQGMFSGNMYSYTENNPITRIDESGRGWITIITVGIISFVGGASYALAQMTTNVLTGTPILEDVGKEFLKGTGSALIATASIMEGNPSLGIAVGTIWETAIDVRFGSNVTLEDVPKIFSSNLVNNYVTSGLPNFDLPTNAAGNMTLSTLYNIASNFISKGLSNVSYKIKNSPITNLNKQSNMPDFHSQAARLGKKPADRTFMNACLPTSKAFTPIYPTLWYYK